MKIAILTTPNQWFEKYAINFAKELKCALFFDHSNIKDFDIDEYQKQLRDMVYLNKDKLKNGIKKFQLEKDNNKVSRAIMTTDSYPKEIAFEVILNNGDKFRIGAIAKGAGMINPAMATMLCFVVTDANITDEMETILKEVVDETFNAISVDGDTSTNDSCFLITNREGGYEKDAFKEGLKLTLQKLAFDIVKDGEGANKFVAFEIKGAKNRGEAQKIGKALSNSLLVKTAIFGGKTKVKTLEKEITLKIPEGTKCGQKFRVKGLGVLNRKTKTKGDLYLKVNVILPKIEELDTELVKMMKDRLTGGE